MHTSGLIVAAGLSSRMGTFKPLMPLEGRTLIESSIDSMLRGGVSSVTVVLGFRAHEVEAVLRREYPPQQVRLTYNTRYAKTDMLQSAKIGIEALPDCDAFFLLPGDMPAVGRGTFEAVAAAMEQTGAAIAFPTLEGWRKHPPLIASHCIPDILSYQGEGGLREIWKRYEGQTATVSVDDVGCAIDNDTMEDYIGCVRYMEQSRRMRLFAIA